MKRLRCREGDVPAHGCCEEMRRRVIGSGGDPGIGGRAARCAAAAKDLDNDHAAAAARARRAMIGRGVGSECVVCCRRLDLRDWGVDKLLGAMLALQPALVRLRWQIEAGRPSFGSPFSMVGR